MSLLLAPDAGNAVLNALRQYIDALSGTLQLGIYQGAVPATAQVPMDAASKVAMFTLSDPCAPAATDKTLTFANPADVVALQNGTATFFRIGAVFGTTVTVVMQGTVSDGSGTGELKLNKVAFVKDEPVSIVEIKLSL